MASIDRMSRVNVLIKQTIADVFEKDHLLKDFNILVTVASVDTAPNLRRSRIGLSFLGGDDNAQAKVLKFIQKKHGVYQREMMKSLTLKYTPVLEFFYDDRLAGGDRVLRILNEMDEDDS